MYCSSPEDNGVFLVIYCLVYILFSYLSFSVLFIVILDYIASLKKERCLSSPIHVSRSIYRFSYVLFPFLCLLFLYIYFNVCQGSEGLPNLRYKQVFTPCSLLFVLLPPIQRERESFVMFFLNDRQTHYLLYFLLRRSTYICGGLTYYLRRPTCGGLHICIGLRIFAEEYEYMCLQERSMHGAIIM